MKLSEIIKPACLVSDLLADDREEAFAALVDIIVDAGGLKAERREDAVLALLKREAMGSTGLKGGVAVPHAKVSFVPDFVGAFGRTQEGIDFGGQRIYAIFLFFSPERAISGHLQLLAHISGILRSGEFVKALREAPDRDAVLKLITDAESWLFK